MKPKNKSVDSELIFFYCLIALFVLLISGTLYYRHLNKTACYGGDKEACIKFIAYGRPYIGEARHIINNIIK